jgi:hypothetical protein
MLFKASLVLIYLYSVLLITTKEVLPKSFLHVRLLFVKLSSDYDYLVPIGDD